MDKLILYRGQIIFDNELNLIRKSKDEYLSFNSFVLRELNKYDEALKNHEEELNIRVKIDPIRRGINIATTYMALAAVYRCNKQYSKAFKYVKGAHAIMPRPHKDLSELYSIAADIYQEKKQLDLAAKYWDVI